MCSTQGSRTTHTYAKKVEGPVHHKHIFLVLFLIIVTKSNAYLDNINVPCKYLDSINITNGTTHTDTGIIEFEGIFYPKQLYATYDYEFTNESYRQPVAKHTRGCTCRLGKSCVRLCCPRGQQLMRRDCIANDAPFNLSVNVVVEDNSVNLFEQFNYVVGLPCRKIIRLDPIQQSEIDSWFLLKDGTISRGDPQIQTLNKNEYCIDATLNNDNFEPILVACYESPESSKDYWILCGMFISVPFLLATIIVYISLPELRNVHGKSLVCYLCGLVVGYTTLGLVKLNGSAHVDAVLCRTMGYTTYFAFISAFFWLNVISYDLWRNFCGIHSRRNFNDLKKFVCYSLYAWGSTMIMAGFCFAMDASSFVPSTYKPGIGIDSCFLGKSRWSQFLYFYLPIILIMSSNLTFFVLTSWKIRRVQIEMSRITDKEESKIHRKNLDSEREKWGLFLRLFVIMGVTWSMEAISFVISPDSSYFYVTDAINTIQGVVIFFMFVLGRKVKQLITRRWKKSQGNAAQTTNVTVSQRSNTLKQSQSHNDITDMEMNSNTSE